MTIKEQFNNLDECAKIIYNQIHEDNYQICKDVVKKTCKNYEDVFYYSFHLVYRTVLSNKIIKYTFDIVQFKKLVDLITREFNLLFLVL